MMPRLEIICGDALETLRTLPDASVQCCVTSPPYWGLRDYGVKGQLGQEKTPDQFVANIVAVFAEVRRVLRNDGTLWLNLGDSYASVGKWGGASGGKHVVELHGNTSIGRGKRDYGELKSKDLIGIPWRVAFALQADGWYLRSDIIWAKRNCMPESVTDRPTRSHEYLFLLTKSERYYYDYEAIKEPCVYDIEKRIGQPNFDNQTGGAKDAGTGNRSHRKVLENIKKRRDKSRALAETAIECTGGLITGGTENSTLGVAAIGSRNRRSVWTVSPANYDGAHFATYPPELITPCILAGTSAHGCCANCGAPFERIVENGELDLEHQKKCGGDKNGEYHGEATKDYAKGGAQDASATKARILAGMRERKTVGWKQRCPSGDCWNGAPPEVIPCTVFDPFAGSGTTGEVALTHGRSAILIELNPVHIPLIEQRCHVTPGLQLA